MDQLEGKLLFTVCTIVLAFLVQAITKKYLTKITERKGFSFHRKMYISNFFGVIYTILVFIGMIFIWDVSLQGFSVFVTSFFTLTAVAFVAQWSMLSNITGSLILFFAYPFKIGDKIRIQDGGENSVEGIITNITLFNIRILTDDGTDISYPNNLALQKPIKKLNENKNNSLPIDDEDTLS
ncbi:mechanosensitive ion channel family protein [Flammeovirga sp. MY04]|uniref:mechanosensitive ion channel family protein n=1 Tax=Flammeovirga sp. MY04 TaxID=1191459 RepID=UPI0008063B1E|nr:mechanosensitive ion channel family protein [Flammeovirga sp. MY04]ANQ51942.1 mechanosensitive ion channel family protein [Flammeovirga sp. MY04]